MWLWECELRRLGLRRLSARYWQGEGRYGLPADAYLSVFAHAEERQAAVRAGGRERLDICAFHVTFCLGVDRVHFYFHEVDEGVWEPGGHTSATEIRRYRREPAELRAVADGVALEFLSKLGMMLMPRDSQKEVHQGEYAMSESGSSPVFMFDNSDPGMQRAYENARENFRFFWREIAWERHRIAAALDLACVKAPFSDGAQATPSEDAPEAEHMWLSEVDFDGQIVSGVLMNSPNWLKTIKEGDTARIPLGAISDWMYVIDGQVFGAYTVNLLRSRMGRRELQEHDAAWGLDFGDPLKVRMVAEHEHYSLSENFAASLREELARNPSLVFAKGHNGWTLLHQHASAGSSAIVKVLLEAGADPNAETDNGMTPLQLARSLGWENVVALLAAR